MKQLAIINPENASKSEIEKYLIREAARAIVTDNDNLIALLHVANKNYYKLPGGGVEGNEDRIAALKRECKEEIGCDIAVIEEIGSIVEYRKMFTLKQISYCFYARIVGSKGIPKFMEDEKTEGFKEVWLPYAEALQSLVQSNANDFEGSAYVVPRDTIFLKTAKAYLQYNQ